MMKVTYLGHSGFLVELEDTYFLFDYYKGQLPETDPEKGMMVFASHAHYDHFQNGIFELRDRFHDIHFIHLSQMVLFSRTVSGQANKNLR